MGKAPLQLVGHRFSRLVVTECVGSNGNGKLKWRAKCDCGAEAVVIGSSLKNGSVRSCGCIKREQTAERNRASATHGMTRGEGSVKYPPEYWAWINMRRRCENPRTRQYPDYGGRGISVCERWRQGFSAFMHDMGRRPSARHSLDRVDNDGNYEPGNCRWATTGEQANNRRNSLTKPSLNGEDRTEAEWCKRLGLHRGEVHRRLQRGWTAKRALTEPPRHRETMSLDGKTRTVIEWAEVLGLHPMGLRRRLTHYGWSIREALTTPKGHQRRCAPARTRHRGSKQTATHHTAGPGR